MRTPFIVGAGLLLALTFGLDAGQGSGKRPSSPLTNKSNPQTNKAPSLQNTPFKPMTPPGKIFTVPPVKTPTPPPRVAPPENKTPGNSGIKSPANVPGVKNDRNPAPLVKTPGGKQPGPQRPNIDYGKLPVQSKFLKEHVKQGGSFHGKSSKLLVPSNLSKQIFGGKQRLPDAKKANENAHRIKGFTQEKKDKMTPSQRDAMTKLGQNVPLTRPEQATLSGMLFSNKPGFSSQESTIISQSLMMNMMHETQGDPEPAPAGRVASATSGVRVHNRTGEPIKLWVQYRVPAENPEAEWRPGARPPVTVPPALEYTLGPGDDEEGAAWDLTNGGTNLAAYSIRFWAMTPSQVWADHMEQELVLTPDANNVYLLTFAK